MSNIAVFPGSFDPITVGHESIVQRATSLFDEIVVAIGVNSNKNYLFSLEKRLSMIEQTFAKHNNVRVASYEGLTIHYCQKIGARYILRGLRNAMDFEFEKTIASMNQDMSGIETTFLISLPEHTAINSTVVRDIIRNEGNAGKYIPSAASWQ